MGDATGNRDLARHAARPLASDSVRGDGTRRVTTSERRQTRSTSAGETIKIIIVESSTDGASPAVGNRAPPCLRGCVLDADLCLVEAGLGAPVTHRRLMSNGQDLAQAQDVPRKALGIRSVPTTRVVDMYGTQKVLARTQMPASTGR